MSADPETDILIAPPEAQPFIGRAIQHYQILSVLGKGGMGEVYLAEDTRLKRQVALKFLPPQFAQDAERLRRFELEARAVPGVPASGSKRQLSTDGGAYPRWRRDGWELYYLSLDGKLMAVEITPGAELKAGTPQELFAPSGYRVDAIRAYTVTGDGQRFLFVTSAEDASVPPFTVVLNWMAEMKK